MNKTKTSQPALFTVLFSKYTVHIAENTRYELYSHYILIIFLPKKHDSHYILIIFLPKKHDSHYHLMRISLIFFVQCESHLYIIRVVFVGIVTCAWVFEILPDLVFLVINEWLIPPWFDLFKSKSCDRNLILSYPRSGIAAKG